MGLFFFFNTIYSYDIILYTRQVYNTAVINELMFISREYRVEMFFYCANIIYSM